MKLSDKILACYYTGIPCLIWGDPGLGKSAVTEFVAKKLDVPIEVIISSTREPSDFLGLPRLTDGGVEYIPPKWTKKFGNDKSGIVFFDELATCSPMIQASLLRIVNEGWVGEYKLPDNTYRIAASNFTNIDGCEPISLAMANRFIHICQTYSNNDFCEALSCGFDYPLGKIVNNKTNKAKYEQLKCKYRAIVANYLKKTVGEYGYILPKDEIKSPIEYAYPTPRSWTNAIEILATLEGNDNKLIKELLEGTIGVDATKSFLKANKTILFRKYILADHMEDYKETFDSTKISYDELKVIMEEIKLLYNDKENRKKATEIGKHICSDMIDHGFSGIVNSFKYDMAFIEKLIKEKKDGGADVEDDFSDEDLSMQFKKILDDRDAMLSKAVEAAQG